jgi:multidrug efflux pump subunit AcrB
MLSKSFTDLFIRKPVIALVVNLVILIVGLVAYTSSTPASIRAATAPW